MLPWLRKNWTIVLGKNEPRLDWRASGEAILPETPYIRPGLPEYRCQGVGISCLAIARPAYPKCLHGTAPCDIEVPDVFLQEFLRETITGGNVHHVVHKQAVDDEVVSLAFHEYCLFTASENSSTHNDYNNYNGKNSVVALL